jgi:hypothetical protein
VYTSSTAANPDCSTNTAKAPAHCSLTLTTALPAKLRKLGASAVGIRYYAADWPSVDLLEEALRAAVAAAEELGLASILLPEFGADGGEGAEGVGGLASRVGAAAGLAKGAAAASEGDAVVLGCWGGGDDELQQLRGDGFRALILKDACGGDVGAGAGRCVMQTAPSMHSFRVGFTASEPMRPSRQAAQSRAP